MNWEEWKFEWSSKHYQWYNNREKYIRGEKFNDNLIGIYKFPSMLECFYAYQELKKIYLHDNTPNPTTFCKGLVDEYFRIHFRCPDLPLVVKICEAFGGVLDGWDTSRIEEPPDDGGIYIPEERKSSSSGCYIATACYGSYDCSQVLTFRNYRDKYLSRYICGRLFIKTYYALSPSIAEWLKYKCRINTFIRKYILEPIYELLKRKY
jgi:hypothetical protein